MSSSIDLDTQNITVDGEQCNDLYMGVACILARNSKNPEEKEGACIVDKGNRIVGVGYNCMPRSSKEVSWNTEYVCHAEMNAIAGRTVLKLDEARIYATLFPCNECAKLIIQAGIKKVLYLSDKYHEKVKFKASRKMFLAAGVKCEEYVPVDKMITINKD